MVTKQQTSFGFSYAASDQQRSANQLVVIVLTAELVK
jgi:hypothetical protein